MKIEIEMTDELVANYLKKHINEILEEINTALAQDIRELSYYKESFRYIDSMNMVLIYMGFTPVNVDDVTSIYSDNLEDNFIS